MSQSECFEYQQWQKQSIVNAGPIMNLGTICGCTHYEQKLTHTAGFYYVVARVILGGCYGVDSDF